MFESFRAAFGPIGDGRVGAPWQDGRLSDVQGYAELAGEYAGVTFGRGLYRIHDAQSGPRALAFVLEAFPEFAKRVVPFGYDWLGRQLAVDYGRLQGDQPEVLLLEPGTGEALQIPATFAAFHDEVLIEQTDAALASGFYEAWTAEPGASLPLGRDECVGYRVPLFLGGDDELENLEVSDVEVYWSICGQLRSGTQQLPPGASINEIRRD